MSYDIFLFKRLGDRPVHECAQEILESEINALEPDALARQGNVLTEKLHAINPDLEEFKSDRHLELTDTATGIQITAFNNQIAVAAPYWYLDEDAKRIFKQIFEYLTVIQNETGYAIYDPQTDTEILLDLGQEKFVEKCLTVSEKMPEIIQSVNNNRSAKPSNLMNYLVMIMLLIGFIAVVFSLAIKLDGR